MKCVELVDNRPCFVYNEAGNSCWRVIQMYLKRKVDAFLEEWKADKNRKPLIVKGSRQIGKTESILHFAADHYENVIEINFVRDEKYKGIIADGYEAADIIKNISLIDPTKKFVPEKTLIFFDEITEFPEIATSLKFFCIEYLQREFSACRISAPVKMEHIAAQEFWIKQGFCLSDTIEDGYVFMRLFLT